MSTPVTAPPSVIEPSAVMSGNVKIRKLMKTPSASSDRIRPIVNAPMSRSMSGRSLPGAGDRADPARAARELAFAGAGGAAVVVDEVQHALQPVGLEEGCHRRRKVD